jgi:predicted protein tyrosine phosphatase
MAGSDKCVLFICGKARMRSPTAADMVASWHGFETDFTGLSKDADELLSSEHLDWADIIVVMEKRQKSKLSSQFGAQLAAKRVVALGVADKYDYMEPALQEILHQKLRKILQG